MAVQLVAAQSMGRSKESIKSPDPTATAATTAMRTSMQQTICDCEGCEDTATAATAAPASDWYEKPADWTEKPVRCPEKTAGVAAPEKAADGPSSSSFGDSAAADWGRDQEQPRAWPVEADRSNNSGSGGGNDCGDDVGAVEGQGGGEGGVKGYDFSRSTEANYEVDVENGTFAER